MTRFSALIFLSVVVGGLSLQGDNVARRASSSSSSSPSSFHRDVVSKVAKKERKQSIQQNMEDELLAKAMPMEEYNRQLKALGVELPDNADGGARSTTTRRLDGDGEDENGDWQDDYYAMDENYMYSFSGYSMKYAKCQPIQQFSEDALAAGEYSPMVTQDIVILRLCPYKSCSESRQYGCHYNYAEYAIGLYDYIRIMLKFRANKKAKLCEFCEECINGRNRKLDENQQDNGQDDYYDADDDGANNNNNNNNDDGAYNNNNNYYYYQEGDECYQYGSYCDNYYTDCQDGDGNNNNNNNNNQYNYYQDDYQYQLQEKMIDEEEYFDYLGCTEFQDNNGNIYFVRPACDSEDSESISMSVYYDEYCSQSASKYVNMDNFQVAFDDEIFEELYKGSCMDCSESNYPPYFDAGGAMCNKIHYIGADCTTNLVYDLFGGQQSDSTECSFIESIRFGTYKTNGEISVEATDDAEEVVTDLQKLGLVGSAIICAIFVVYACYLHHSMTNLLIKSLSHRELLPPSRHSKRRSPGTGNGKPKSGRRSKGSKGGRGRHDDDDDDDEWDRSKPLRSPV